MFAFSIETPQLVTIFSRKGPGPWPVCSLPCPYLTPSPLQKMGSGTVMVSISISLGSYCFRRLMRMVAISSLSSVDSLVSNREKTGSLPDRKVR